MIKRIIKRFLSLAMILVIVIGLLPTVQMESPFISRAYAAESIIPSGSLNVANAGYLGVEASNNNGNCGQVTLNENTVTVVATGDGASCSASKTTTTATFTNKSSGDMIVTCSTNGGTLSTASPINLSAGESFTLTIESTGTALSDKGTAVLTISSINLAAANYTTTFASATNGSYTVTYGGDSRMVGQSYTEMSSTPYIMNATAASGYTFYAWVNGSGETLSTKQANFEYTAASDSTIKPIFYKIGSAMYYIQGKTNRHYGYFDEAITAAGTSGTIVVAQSGTVYGSTGQTTFTISSKQKLLVPKSASDTGNFTDSADRESSANSLFRKLTIPSGVTINCAGSIGVSGGQNCTAGGNPTGISKGPFGQIQIDQNAVLNINNGGKLYCYGYITGTGTVNLKSGASLYELMQVMDWRGGSCSSDTVDENGLFPMNQFYIQNVEASLNMYSGSSGYISATLSASGMSPTVSIKYFGTNGLFNVTDGCLNRKLYGSRIDYTLNSGAMSISSISINVGFGINFSSSSAILGIPSNMSIAAENGSINITNSVALLPSTRVVIGEGTSATVSGDIYLIDYAVWKGNNYAKSGDYYPLPYTCTNGSNGTKISTLTSSNLQVDGTLTVQSGGGIFTTSAKKSSDVGVTGTGKIVYQSTKESPKYSLTAAKGTKYDNTVIPLTPLLATFAGISSNASDLKSIDANTYYGLSDNHTAGNWYQHLISVKNGDSGVTAANEALVTGANYVTVSREGTSYSNIVGYSASGGTYSFTVDGSVTSVKVNDALVTPNSGLYTINSIDGDREIELIKEANYTVTWKSQDGSTTLGTSTVAGGATPDYPSNFSEPTKTTTAQYTYAFAGWATSANQTSGTALASLPAVTADITYYAAFSQTVRSYTITWQQDDGTQIDATTVAYGAIPSHANPTKAATAQYTYAFNGWTPAITSVTGTATYKATYTQTARSYTVTLNTNDGTINSGNITSYAYGTAKTLPSDVTKSGYSFGGWYESSTFSGTPVTTISATATGDKTFYAKWNGTYTVTIAWSGMNMIYTGESVSTKYTWDGATQRYETSTVTAAPAGWTSNVGAVTVTNSSTAGAIKATPSFSATASGWTPAMSFYSNSGCTNAYGSPNIAIGNSSTFYGKLTGTPPEDFDAKAGNITVTIAAGTP